MSAPAVGDVVAEKYRVERVLGQGGMGVVLAAQHLHLGNEVAIKCLLPEAAKVPEALARFVQEARTCARMRNEHVVRVYDVGTLANGAPFLVMELLSGRDLADHLRERGPLPLDEVVGYALEVCEGLAEAHSEGIVHRDLKPSNVFIVPRKSGGRGSVKILDFGISKLMNPPSAGPGSLSRTSTGSLLGSPYYMAPEQILNPAGVDARADIWSLGVVLYELCSGSRPFDGETAAMLLGKILTDPTPMLRSLRPDAPPWLEELVARCLEKDPNQRFQNVTELARALSAGASSGPVPLALGSGPVSLPASVGSVSDPLGATALAPSDRAAIEARRAQLTGQQAGDTQRSQPDALGPSRPSVCLSVAVRGDREPTLGGLVSAGPRGGRRWALGLGAAGAVAAASAGAWALLRDKNNAVRVRGSSTVIGGVMPRWKTDYERKGRFKLEATSTGTTRGIDELLRGDCDLAAASRKATPQEISRSRSRLQEHVVGYDAIAIVTNVDNTVPSLTLPQLRDLFSGKAHDWGSLGGAPGAIHLVLRPEELGGHEALRSLLGDDLKFVDGAEVLRTNEELVRRLSADRLAVSFASFTVTGPVRQIPIGASDKGPFLAPSSSTIRQGTYPLVRPLLLYTLGPPRGPAAHFLDFVQGSVGQDSVLNAGFVPLK